MIYLAALSHVELHKPDFLRLIGHNKDFGSTYFDAKVAMCESKQPAGKMRRFVWQVRDNNITTDDLTVVILFNETREKRGAFAAQIKLKQHKQEIDAFYNWLANSVKPKSVETGTTDEGNIFYTFRQCDFSHLTGVFANHARRLIAGV